MDENTPLHIACLDNNLQQVIRLLETNDDVCKKNVLGDTPLHIACKRQNIDIITAILDKNKKCIDNQNSNEYTALMIACMMRNDDMVELLLSNGANPSVIKSNGETAYSIAVELGERGIASKIKSMELALSPPETLTRSISTSHSYQGLGPTCMYHSLAKIYGQNIFKIHTESWSDNCDKYLDTTKPHNFNIDPVCNKDKIIMFYYIYFLLKKIYHLNWISRLGDVPDIISRILTKEIPDELIEYKSQIDLFLDKPVLILYQVFVFNKHGNNNILYRYLYHCLKHLKCYVGMTITHSKIFNIGHSLVVVDIKDKKLDIKNSWFNKRFLLPISDLHEDTTYIEHVPFMNSTIKFYFIIDLNSVPGNPKNQKEFEKSFIHTNTEINFEGGKTKRNRKRKTKKYK